MKFSTGSEFGNRYVLGDRIAVGGMGEVWKATDQVLGRTVAIKLLSPSLADQPGFTQRFREEARNTAALGHPNIAAVYDYGEDAGASWLVMEYVDGRPLSQIIKDDGPIDARRTSLIVAQAASALQAAHDAGVIHRDVKPANILVRRDGTVKLTDFGISRAIDAAPITRTGEVMGTAQYISPEQAMGRPVAPSSDIYSLGVVAYEMLTGERAFDEGSPVATAMAHIHNPAPPLPASVPEPLNGVVMACLAKDTSLRPASAGDVADTLRGVPGAQTFAHTEVLGNQARTQRLVPSATQRVVPPATASQRYAVEEPEPRKRSPLLWVVPLLIVLALLAGWGLTQSGLFMGNTGGPSTPAVTPTQSASPTQTPTPTPTNIDINARDYRGLSLNEAAARLKGLGLYYNVNRVTSDQPRESVIDINPTGSVAPGSTVALTVSNGPAQTQAPSPTTSSPSATTSEPTRDTEPTPAQSSAPTQGGGGTGGAGGNNGLGSLSTPQPTNTSQPETDSADGQSGATSGATGAPQGATEGTVQ